MPANIKDLLNNTKDIFMTDSAVNTLLDFERVLDELDLYAFAHWKQGELVEGPVYEKYFVKCTFMWPYKKMPDPKGAVRLSEYDCEVLFKQDFFEHPIKENDEGTVTPGSLVTLGEMFLCLWQNIIIQFALHDEQGDQFFRRQMIVQNSLRTGFVDGLKGLEIV